MHFPCFRKIENCLGHKEVLTLALTAASVLPLGVRLLRIPPSVSTPTPHGLLILLMVFTVIAKRFLILFWNHFIHRYHLSVHIHF